MEDLQSYKSKFEIGCYIEAEGGRDHQPFSGGQFKGQHPLLICILLNKTGFWMYPWLQNTLKLKVQVVQQ